MKKKALWLDFPVRSEEFREVCLISKTAEEAAIQAAFLFASLNKDTHEIEVYDGRRWIKFLVTKMVSFKAERMKKNGLRKQ